ncbi:hypothetical protein L1887_27442 [Cichorium endivia]|nr:hypothetical protein L1887_27442 [Cichorium endivia]
MSLQYRCTASILFSLEPGHPTASRLRFDSLNAFTAASIQRHRSHPYSPRISWVLSPVFLRRLPGDLRAPVRENGKTKRAIEDQAKTGKQRDLSKVCSPISYMISFSAFGRTENTSEQRKPSLRASDQRQLTLPPAVAGGGGGGDLLVILDLRPDDSLLKVGFAREKVLQQSSESRFFLPDGVGNIQIDCGSDIDSSSVGIRKNWLKLKQNWTCVYDANSQANGKNKPNGKDILSFYQSVVLTNLLGYIALRSRGGGGRDSSMKESHGRSIFMQALHSQCATILMAAGDTFRAAASDQLGIWAERTGCEIVLAEKEKAKAPSM